MTQETESLEAAQSSNTRAVQTLLQFVRMVRYRRNVVIVSLAICCSLGGLYYATATRYYESKASLMVWQTGADVTNTSISGDGSAQGLMPTYERLFSMAVVLEGALPYIDAAHRIDLQGPESMWPSILQKGLILSTVRGTNIVDVGFRSRDPETASVVINAILKSYLEYIDKTHRGTSGEILKLLTEQKAQLEIKLAAKDAELLAARQASGDLSLPSGGSILPPALQKAVTLSTSLTAAQEKRLQLQAMLAAITLAVERGEDLQQYLMAMQSGVAKEMLMAAMGVELRPANDEISLQKNILEDQAKLASAKDFLGPKHPTVIQFETRIRNSKEYIAQKPFVMAGKLAELRGERLGPLLTGLLQQQISQAWQEEVMINNSFEQAKIEAIRMHGDLARIETLSHELQRLRDLADVLVNQIANVDLKQDHGSIRTAVVSEPQIATSPVSPKLTIVLILSVLSGSGLGLLVVYVLDVLDDRFRSPEDLRTQLGVPVLAMIRPLPEHHALGLDALQVHIAPDSIESEAFRTLRTTLAFAQHDTSRLVVSSAEPGDGKTTVLANLAVSFAQAGKRTLLIDADLRRPGLTNLLSLKGVSGLSDLLISDEDLKVAVTSIIKPSAIDGLHVIPAGARRPNPAELLASPRLADLLAWAESRYDQILIDCPPALAASDAAIVGRLGDGLVLVVQPRKNKRRMVVRAAESILALNVNVIGVVLNRISSESGEGDYSYGYGYGYGHTGYGEDTDEVIETEEYEATVEAIVPRRVA